MKTSWIQVARGYLSDWKNGLQERKGIRVFYYHGICGAKERCPLGTKLSLTLRVSRAHPLFAFLSDIKCGRVT